MLRSPLDHDSEFWDVLHFFGVIGNRLGSPVPLADFAEWAVPVDLFPAKRGVDQRFEAFLFVAIDLLRPLSWLGLVDDQRGQRFAISLEKRLIQKTALFDRFVRIVEPTADVSTMLH